MGSGPSEAFLLRGPAYFQIAPREPSRGRARPFAQPLKPAGGRSRLLPWRRQKPGRGSPDCARPSPGPRSSQRPPQPRAPPASPAASQPFRLSSGHRCLARALLPDSRPPGLLPPSAPRRLLGPLQRVKSRLPRRSGGSRSPGPARRS